jgi:hypothetical protein
MLEASAPVQHMQVGKRRSVCGRAKPQSWTAPRCSCRFVRTNQAPLACGFGNNPNELVAVIRGGLAGAGQERMVPPAVPEACDLLAPTPIGGILESILCRCHTLICSSA